MRNGMLFRALLVVLAIAILASEPAQAQSFSVLFNFSQQSGYGPFAGVTRDAAGNLYGTTTVVGDDNSGTVYELKDSHMSWSLNNLFAFSSRGNPGYFPWSGVVFGPDSAMYGTTLSGGANGDGIVYKLAPPPTICRTVLCSWEQTVLYEFQGSPDGASPALGNVIFDRAGNLYGTTAAGGAFGKGTVFELSPSNGGWTEKVLYSFMGGTDGSDPYGTLVFDSAGNLYGTTPNGGNTGCSENDGCGTVFELSPSGSGWTERILVTFEQGSNGCNPYGGLIFDQSGNLYGTTALCGAQNGGTVFELSPNGDNWTFSLLYALGPDISGLGGPLGSLAIDGAGSLYGTTQGDGNAGQGTAFKLTLLNGAWTYTELHEFIGGPDDGSEPIGGPIVDAMGVVYGTTYAGGSQSCSFEEQCGVIWAITP
jgi:uncharacterized repeat protein (TIGR03803 family)